MVALIITAALAMQTAKPPVPELVFSVELQDPIAHHVRLSSSVVIGEPFSFEVHRGEVDCVIAGTIPTPVSGVFTFPVKIEESQGQKMSIKGSQTVVLQLGKPYSGGPVASFVYMRTFKLTESGVNP